MERGSDRFKAPRASILRVRRRRISGARRSRPHRFVPVAGANLCARRVPHRLYPHPLPLAVAFGWLTTCGATRSAPSSRCWPSIHRDCRMVPLPPAESELRVGATLLLVTVAHQH